MKFKAPKLNLTDRLRLRQQEQLQRKCIQQLPAHLCLVDLKAARGSHHDWLVLSERLAFGALLARNYFNTEAEVELHLALVALSATDCTLPGRDNQWFVTPEEAYAIAQGIVLTDRMEDQCSADEIRHVWKAAQRLLSD